MRKIRLSDTDLELFDIEISPSDYNFYHKHKDAFKTMWREQGTPFWTRFVITFRSFTVKHGVIKQMNIDTPKFQNLIDQAFIFMHEQFVDGNDKSAKNFIEDVARLAQHQDKLPALDSKSFAKDPFYARDTRELFRQFFGKPDQRSSYLKVYILCPVYLRFGGSVCRCLVRWVDAPILDNPDDDSYWTKPQDSEVEISHSSYSDEGTMCDQCIDNSGTQFFKEKINGSPKRPMFLDFWTKGDPRFNDPENPLFAPHVNPDDDWREQLCIEKFRNFLQYAKLKYLPENEQCLECKFLRDRRDKVEDVCKKNKKKKKKSKKKTEDFISDLKEFRDRLDELEDCVTKEDYDQRVLDIIEMSPNVMEVVEEVQKESRKQQADPRNHNTPKSNSMELTCFCSHDDNMSIFSDDTKITDEIQYSILTKEDDTESKSVVAGFKVIKIEDTTNGLYEVNISAASIKGESEEDHNQRMNIELQKNELNCFLLTASLLREKLSILPRKFEWWEGRGFCVAVLNYEVEEKQIVKKWTNFSLKVAGFKEKFIKKIMLSLLNYIGKRKSRTCHGWNMDVDDVVACILTEEAEIIEDLSISIQRGFRFEDRLTDAERESLVKHQPHFCFTKILMGMEAGEASTLLTEKGGKDKLKKMCKVIADFELYGGKYIDGLMKELRKTETNGETKESMIWDFIIADPDKFEFFCIVDKQQELDFKKTGMKTVDIPYYMSRKKPTTPICPICKAVGPKCCCGYCNDSTNVENFSDDSYSEVNVPDNKCSQKGTKELNGNTVNRGKETGKKSKSAAKKFKDRKIELTSLPKKFQDVGIIADKALISIPTNEEIEPMMGKIPINDQEERMAPIPGLSSSLNLILQNGGKEQTINVSLGAYMPEGKIQQIQEKKGQMKLHTIEAHREVEKMIRDEKKDEKRAKKDKPGNCKYVNGHGHDTADKTDGGLNAMFLREILGSDEASRVAKQWNTQHGISYKKQPLDGMTGYEKRKQAEKEAKAEKEPDAKEKERKDTKSHDNIETGDKENVGQKSEKKQEKKQKQETNKDNEEESLKESSEKNTKSDKAMYSIYHNDKGDDKSCSYDKLNTNNSNLTSSGTGKKGLRSSKPTDDELSHNFELLSEGIPEKCSLLVIDHEKREKLDLTPNETLRIQEVIEKKIMESKLKSKKVKKSVEKNGKISDEDRETGIVDSAGTLKVCWCCFIKEPVRKAFKKCQKCKDEGVKDPRYYCSRECQMDDWKNRHKQEHKDKKFPPHNKST